MIRLLVVVLSIIGAAALFGRIFPSLAHVAFMAGGYGISWLMLVSLGSGFLTFKITR